MSAPKLRCPDCDGTEIDHDPARGDAVCVDCGRVLEESVIVAEVGFAEDSRGRSNVVGQHVSAHGRPNSFSVLPGFSREATALTMTNGRRRIWNMVSALRLTSRHAEAALRLFRLAVERNFHKGRRMTNVCCACLYVVVRIERTPHMLIDFSDVLETNVYVLGNTFLKFAQILNIELPIIDPSLYIHRFASKLEFGDKTHAVAMSALRLLARMRRDWMSYGRRPNGLCGAALIIAARMHNFYRSQTDVVRVVRIGNVALRDRLQELTKTPTMHLTASQIDAGGGDDGKVASLNENTLAPACDPPAFKSKDLPPLDSIHTDADGTAPPAVVVGGIDVSLRAEGQRTEADADLERELAEALSDRHMQRLEAESHGGGIGGAPAAGPSSATNAGSAGDATQGSATQLSLDDLSQTPAQVVTGIRPARPPVDDMPPKIDDELSDLDDEDVATYLNTEEEYKVKEAVWTELNKDYLENQARLEKLKRENPEEYKRQRPWRGSKKRKTPDDSPDATPSTPAEAVRNVMPKASSKKLNYAVLKQLRSKASGAARVGAAPSSAAEDDVT